MAQTELFDVFNEQMEKVGVETRGNVHLNGLWHQTFHCWVIQKSKDEIYLLLQLRHKDKDTYPNMLDISAAGHLLTGETLEDGVRELEEELGISVTFNELSYCGMVAQENVISSNLIDREFNHIFIYESNLPIDQYHFQIDEISGLYLIKYSDFKKLVLGDVKQVRVEGIVKDEISQKNIYDARNVRVDDITPNSNAYYELLFNCIEMHYFKGVNE